MMQRLLMFRNFDARQKQYVLYENYDQLRARLRRELDRYPHIMDGLTVGEPEDGAAYVTMAYNESSQSEETEWEFIDNTSGELETTVGTLEEVATLFINKVIEGLVTGEGWGIWRPNREKRKLMF